MSRFWNRANAVTVIGLGLAVLSMIFAAHGDVPKGVVALVGAGICDLFDGLLARRLTRTEEEKRFGGRLDSLVDACSFGMAPVALLHAAGMTSPLELLVLAGYAAAAIWRLAYFDTVGIETSDGVAYYRGVPTTYAAVVIPVTFLVGFWAPGWLRIVANVVAVAFALAMVSPLRWKKPGGLWYAGFSVTAVATVAVYLTLGGRFGTP